MPMKQAEPTTPSEQRAWFQHRMATMAAPAELRPANALEIEDLACLAELPVSDPDEKTRELREFRERLLRR